VPPGGGARGGPHDHSQAVTEAFDRLVTEFSPRPGGYVGRVDLVGMVSSTRATRSLSSNDGAPEPRAASSACPPRVGWIMSGSIHVGSVFETAQSKM